MDSCCKNKNADACHEDQIGDNGLHRTKIRTEQEYRSLTNRLKRIEGQVRGVSKMVEESAYCPDILIQVSAVQSALSAFAKELLASHIRTCVSENIRSGNGEAVEELVRTVEKLMR